MIELKEKIKGLIERGYSKREIAKACGVTRLTVHKWALGGATYELNTITEKLDKLAEAESPKLTREKHSNEIAQTIKYLRAEKRYTTPLIAQALNTSAQQIRNWEGGAFPTDHAAVRSKLLELKDLP